MNLANEQVLSHLPSRDVEVFMQAAVELGAEFLACGGPVTRLESQLVMAGNRKGYDTTVHATPLAINIYCHVPDLHKTFSRCQRIESFGVDLGRLRQADKLLRQFAEGTSRSYQVIRRLHLFNMKYEKPPFGVHLMCVFGIGAGVALLKGADAKHVFECGIFTLVSRLLISGVNNALPLNAIFADFLACFIAFVGAIGAANYYGVSPYLLSLGTLVYVVPGLLLTTAMSEIVDQNYLSGSIRLLKALCTFMAMALAYYMAVDLGKSLNFDVATLPGELGPTPTLSIRMLGAAMIIFCSSLEFGAPRKSLWGIMACGLAGMLTYCLTVSAGDLVKPYFLASFVISLLSFQIGRLRRQPSQIFSVPSVLVLAPGMLAFSSFGYGASADLTLPSIVRAALISLSIVFGLAAGRLRIKPLRWILSPKS